MFKKKIYLQEIVLFVENFRRHGLDGFKILTDDTGQTSFANFLQLLCWM